MISRIFFLTMTWIFFESFVTIYINILKCANRTKWWQFVFFLFFSSFEHHYVKSYLFSKAKEKEIYYDWAIDDEEKIKKKKKFFNLCNKLKRNNRYNMIRYYIHENFEYEIKKIFEKMNENEKTYREIKNKYKHLMINWKYEHLKKFKICVFNSLLIFLLIHLNLKSCKKCNFVEQEKWRNLW